MGAVIEVVTGDPIEIGISTGPTDTGASVAFADTSRIVADHGCSGAGAIVALVVDGTGIVIVAATGYRSVITIAGSVASASGIITLRTGRGVADFLRAGIAGAIIALID